MKARKQDALAALLEHCDGLWSASPARIKREQAKTRRLVRALLKERAEAAADAAETYCGWTTSKAARMYVRAAVLSRPARRGKS